MKTAFVDTSVFSRIALREAGHEEVEALLKEFHELKASTLLDAELRSVCKRAKLDPASVLGFQDVRWVAPPFALTYQIGRALEEGYLRGADLWHVACALYHRLEVPDLAFVTVDERQADIARALGFVVLPQVSTKLQAKERAPRYGAKRAVMRTGRSAGRPARVSGPRRYRASSAAGSPARATRRAGSRPAR